jgi:hypothetical protein
VPLPLPFRDRPRVVALWSRGGHAGEQSDSLGLLRLNLNSPRRIVKLQSENDFSIFIKLSKGLNQIKILPFLLCFCYFLSVCEFSKGLSQIKKQYFGPYLGPFKNGTSLSQIKNL